VRWGAVAGIDTGTRGSIYLDGYRAWDTPKTDITYKYDGDGKLVYRKVGTSVTAYIGERPSLALGACFEWTAVGNTKYYYGAGKRVALRRSGYVGSLNGLFFILSDHLGSTYRLIDGSGAPQYDLLYRPWGKPRVDSGAALPGFKFTGQREGDMGLLVRLEVADMKVGRELESWRIRKDANRVYLMILELFGKAVEGEQKTLAQSKKLLKSPEDNVGRVGAP
jgi:hypothetical protein